MNKQFFYAVFTCIVMLILIGCGGTSGYKTDAEPVVYTSVRVGNDGRLAETITPSKFKIVANNVKTLAPNVEVVVSEKDAKGDESEYFNTASKIYTISSICNGNNQVKLLEKPFVITIPNLINSTDVSRFYIGVRESSEVAWSYTRINDVNNTSVRAVMAVKEFTFEIYKASFQTALFAQLPSSKNKKNSDVKVDNITVVIEPDRFGFDKKTYSDDIAVHASLTGENLSKLKNSDVVFKVYYLTSSLEQFDLNVEDAIAKPASISDLKPGEGGGDKYTNYFVVTNPKLVNITDNLSELRFCIKTKGKASYETFPKLFNIEIFSSSTSKILSFYYNCSVKLKELTFINAKLVNKLIDVDEPIKITFDGEIAKNVDFSKYVTVYDSQNDKIVSLYSYVDKILAITPKSNLQYNSTYSINISNSLPTASEAFKLNSFIAEFKTKEEIKKQDPVLLTVKFDNSGDLPVDTSLEIVFSGDLSEKAVFSDYVSVVDNAKNTIKANFSYSNRILLIKPATNLNYDTEYTILIKEGLPTVSATTKVKKETFTFHTQTKPVEPTKPTVVVTSPSDFSKLDLLPTFVLKFSKPMQTSTQNAVSIKQKSNDAVTDLIYTWSDSNKTLNVTPKNKLNQDTDYTFCFDAIKSADTEGQRVESFKRIDFKTKTLPPISVSMVYPNNTSVDIDTNIVLEFSEPISWSNDDLSKITINNGARFKSGVIDDRILTLTLEKNLKYSTAYTINITDTLISIISGQKIQENTFVFNTKANDIYVSVSSQSYNEIENIKKYYLKPEIIVDFGCVIDEETIAANAKNAIKIKTSNDAFYKSLSEFNARFEFIDNQSARIVFDSVLQDNTTYFLHVEAFANSDCSIIKTNEDFAFTTVARTIIDIDIEPVDEAEDVDINQPINITYNKLDSHLVNVYLYDFASSPKQLDYDATYDENTCKINYNLAYGRTYTIGIASYADLLTGQQVQTATYTFKTTIPTDIIGEGTEIDPYQIWSAEQLASVAYNVNHKITDYSGKYLKQMVDIDLNEYNPWSPIGYSLDGSDSPYFRGHYLGNYKIITNLNLNDITFFGLKYSGLFGAIENASIRELGVRHKNMSILTGANDILGLLVAYAVNSDITCCYTSGSGCSVACGGYCYAGGIIGLTVNNCYISNCFSTNIDFVGNTFGSRKGGLVGSLSSETNLKNSYSTNTLGEDRDYHPGSLIGATVLLETAKIESCFSTNTDILRVGLGDAGISYCSENGYLATTEKPTNWQNWDDTIWNLNYATPMLRGFETK